MLWNIPFGYQSFIGKNQEESEAFEIMLEHKGLDKTNIGKLPKDIQTEIIKSWDKVLDLDFDTPCQSSPKENKAIQATFWKLTLNEVVKVDEFVAR